MTILSFSKVKHIVIPLLPSSSPFSASFLLSSNPAPSIPLSLIVVFAQEGRKCAYPTHGDVCQSHTKFKLLVKAAALPASSTACVCVCASLNYMCEHILSSDMCCCVQNSIVVCEFTSALPSAFRPYTLM